MGWKRLDVGIRNGFGPGVRELEDRPTRVVADTHAATVYAYDYDGATGTASDRRTFATTLERNGFPDGSCIDDDGGFWSCLLAAGEIVRYTSDGVNASVDTGVEMPSDVAFGGRDLETLFFTSIAVEVGGLEIKSPNAGALMAVRDHGYRGRPEPRFKL